MSSIFIPDNDEFSLLWVELQLNTIHPFLHSIKTLGQLCHAPVNLQVNFRVVCIEIMGDIETGNDLTGGGSVESEKERTQD